MYIVKSTEASVLCLWNLLNPEHSPSSSGVLLCLDIRMIASTDIVTSRVPVQSGIFEEL